MVSKKSWISSTALVLFLAKRPKLPSKTRITQHNAVPNKTKFIVIKPKILTGKSNCVKRFVRANILGIFPYPIYFKDLFWHGS